MPEIIKYPDQIKATDKVALYGAGSFGKYVLERIVKERPDLKVETFIDDRRKDDFEGLPVCDLDHFTKNFKDVKIIITSSYWKLIAEKVEKHTKDFFIADLLSAERKQNIYSRKIFGMEIFFYTPNQFLYEVANRVDDIEPGTNKWLNEMSDAVLYDIGASCGIYSMLAGLKGNKIVAVEPDALNFSIIKRNLFLNRDILKGEFIPLNVALASRKSILTFSMLEFGEGFHGRFTSNSERSSNAMFYNDKVIGYSLDELIKDFDLPQPTHIKIDVDGAEFDVLSGMERTLAGKELKEILFEMNADQEEKIIGTLSSYGFKFIERQKIHEITGTEVHGVANLLFKRNHNDNK